MQLMPDRESVDFTVKILKALGLDRAAAPRPSRVKYHTVSAAEKRRRRAVGKRQRAARTLHRNIRRGRR